MIALLLIACLSFDDIQQNYYSEDSFRIAAATTSQLCMEGDSLNIALNRISRANYKHGNYQKAMRLANKIQHRGHERLRLNTMALKALLWQNMGNLRRADSLYKDLLEEYLYPRIAYEVHLNYAELHRLRMDYSARGYHLLLALSLSDGRERNKTLRVLARHYFKVMQEFDSAQRIIEQHPTEGLTDEGQAGYYLLQAEFAESQKNYQRADQYYRQASQVAQQAGFLAFAYDAVDGAMRVQILQEEEDFEQLIWYITLLVMLIVGVGIMVNNIKMFYGKES